MHWVRFERAGQTGFGTLRDGVIRIHEGDMFEGSSATSATVPLADVTLLTPCVPTKMIALWNNFYALAAKLNLTAPPSRCICSNHRVRSWRAAKPFACRPLIPARSCTKVNSGS